MLYLQEDEEQSIEDDQDGREEEEDYSVGFLPPFLLPVLRFT